MAVKTVGQTAVCWAVPTAVRKAVATAVGMVLRSAANLAAHWVGLMADRKDVMMAGWRAALMVVMRVVSKDANWVVRMAALTAYL
jgi:hypothetical protein